MSVYSHAPSYREFRLDKPTLLVCWWATAMCTAIILLRLAGRFIRTERLFTEDRIAAAALLPLYLRMGCVHFILLHGTNNVRYNGIKLSDEKLSKIAVASGLVLASRIFFAATLWTLKFAILEFFNRLTGVTWSRNYRISLVVVRWILVATFIPVIVSDFVECRPFSNYWQVLPDPGPQCRQGYAQLITTAACNVLTDLLLVFFPIPIILTSHMTVKRKIQLTLLFSLGLSVVAVTLYRVPMIIDANGRQQLRSLLSSIELIFATASANALVLGSFVRDRGVKKQKFRRGSAAGESLERTTTPRRPTMHRHWGSDEDLVRDVGLAVDPELRAPPTDDQQQPRPIVAKSTGDSMQSWQFPQRQRSQAEHSDDSLLSRDQLASRGSADSPTMPRKVSFFDVGGLLDDSNAGTSSSHRRSSHTSSGGEPSTSHYPAPSSSVTASTSGPRRGSTALLQDLGGFLGSRSSQRSKSKQGGVGTELETIPQSSQEQRYYSHGKPDPELIDPGGLLR